MVDGIGTGTPTPAPPHTAPTEQARPIPHGAPPEGTPVGGASDGTITFMSADGSVPVLALPKNMDADVMMTLLYAIRQKQSQEQIKTSENRIEDKKAERQKKHEEILKKIKKMHDAEKKGGVGAKIGMAFGWVGVGLAWVAVGVVAVVSGGTAAIPLAIAATAMTALMIAQQTGATDKAVEAMNLDDKGAMGLQIGLAATMLVINIGAAILSGGAASGGVASGAANVAAAGTEAGVTATEAATAGAEAGAAAAEIGTTSAEAVTEASVAASEAATTGIEAGSETAASTATITEEGTTAADGIAQTAARSGRLVRVANRVRSAAVLAQAVPQAGGGAAQISTAEFRHQAASARADAQDERAEMAKAQEITLEELRRIRKLLQAMQNVSTLVIGTIDESQETAMQVRRTI